MMYELTIVRDALFNTSARSGATVDYSRGVVVGIVSALMASGIKFDAAFAVVKANMPDDAMEGVIPPSW
jgi:hypothetical protein